MIKSIDLKFKIGQDVYLKTDVDQKTRLIVGINIKPDGINYELSCADTSSWHFDFEISKEKNILASI